MIKKIAEWFQVKVEQDSQPEHTVQLATAVLLYEIMRADDKFTEAERHTFRQCLLDEVHMNDEEVDELIDLTTKTANDAVDFSQFTRVINQSCDMSQKHTIMDRLWKIAFADHKLDPHEEHLIRRISELLYVSHSQFIKSKLDNQPPQ